MNSYCRGFVWGCVVGLLIVCFMLASCSKARHEKNESPTPVSYSATILNALEVHAARHNERIKTRDTSFGKEVIEVGGHIATKGTAADDGFVVLLDGMNPGGALDLAPLHVFGVHTIEVRHVPFGKEGKDVTPFLTFQIDVR